jgi:hypothetical protein
MFQSQNWSILKLILLCIIILLIIIISYLLLKDNTSHFIQPNLQLYTNEIISLQTEKEIRKYQPYAMQQTIRFHPCTISFWMNFTITKNESDKITKTLKPPFILFYMGNLLNNYSLMNMSIQYDESKGGYQLIYETNIHIKNNMYFNNKNQKNLENLFFRVNEWVFYSISITNKSIEIYVNGELQQIFLCKIPPYFEMNNPIVYFHTPKNEFPYINVPKSVFSFQWYEKILTKEQIKQIYVIQKNILDELIVDYQPDSNRICSK